MSAEDRSAAHETRHYANRLFRLELSRTARAFGKEESIWDRELRQMFRFVSRHNQALERWQQEAKEGRHQQDRVTSPQAAPVLSMAVFGTYGSGKSSLIKTFVREARRKEPRPELYKMEATHLYSLPVIEPNLHSSDDHFLYAFLATALEEDMQHRRRDEEREASGAQTLSPVQHAFERLSEYLQVIDAQREQRYDPLGVSLERLDRHTSDFRLRDEMSRFIDVLADNLAGRRGNSVLILPVDDADLSLDKLVATLDTYRRYLLHPRLVPVFAFTGRLAEELLQAHHAKQLSDRALERSGVQRRRRRESPDLEHLDITEHLAVQYLVKLFPIRNRIRIGYPPVRVQAAKYRTVTGESRRVADLLETSSYLLFGYPHWPTVPRIRITLRPATLRRQLQVLDAMYEAWVEAFLGEPGKDSNGAVIRQLQGGEDQPTWVEIFQQAGWSLLNVHRDVLREFHLHVEELYSWTPRGLRREILRILLELDAETRQTLLKRWRFRIEDRRAQVLSLLAVLAFRPELPDEEHSGEDPDQIFALVYPGEGEPSRFPTAKHVQNISAVHAAMWFLELWIGFYLPQILAENVARSASPAGRPAAAAEENDPEEEPVVGIGWNLRAGPIHAFFQLAAQGRSTGSGMLRLDESGFSKVLTNLPNAGDAPAAAEDPASKDKDAADRTSKEQLWTPRQQGLLVRLKIDVWCIYGFQRREPWVAVSLWRGLGLLGQLLEDFQRFRASWPTSREHRDREHRRRIKAILRNHCTAARRAGTFNRERRNISFVAPPLDDPDVEVVLNRVAAALLQWLGDLEEQQVDPMPAYRTSRAKENRFAHAWKQSFLRRLHGSEVVGDLQIRLDSSYYEPSPKQTPDAGGERGDEDGAEVVFSAGEVLGSWLAVLETYFAELPADGPKRQDDDRFWSLVFENCPLLAPWGVLDEEERKSQAALLTKPWNDWPETIKESPNGLAATVRGHFDHLRGR